MTTTQKHHVPVLRFSEFSGAWDQKTLLELSKNGFSNGVFNDPKKVGSGYKLINVKNMYEGNKITLENLTLLEVSKEEFVKNRVSWGDILFTRSSLVKEGIAHSSVFLSKDEFTTYDGHLIKMSPNRNLVDAQYLGYALVTDFARKQLVARGKTTTMTTIGQEDIASVAMILGTTKEQQKIAAFLTTVDTKIEQLGKKKSLLEKYKKGMMQKLFSQVLRFKDEKGDYYPDWEEKRLGELYEITSSKRVFQSEWKDEGVPFYRAREIIKLGKNGYVDNNLFISPEMFEEYAVKYGAPKKDDLLVTGVGTIGKVYQVPEGNKFYFKDGNIVWLKSTGKVMSSFVNQLFKSRHIKKQISEGAAITTVATYTIDSAKKTKIYLPCASEQQKIANFLSALDQKINLVATELKQAQTFKKGLLQQMFI